MDAYAPVEGKRGRGRPKMMPKSVRHFFEAPSQPTRTAQAAQPAPPADRWGFGAAESGLIAAENRYDASGTGRRVRGWRPGNAGPNSVMEGLETLRGRSRDSSRNDWASSAADRRWTSTLIGVAIAPRSKRRVSDSARLRRKELWDNFVRKSDADCVLNFYGQESLATLTWLSAGECFARFRYRPFDPKQPDQVPLQVQLLEPEYCPLLNTDSWYGMAPGNRIRQGIELNKRGERVAYWFYRAHPQDGPVSTAIDMAQLLRVPASEVMHIYEPLRIGQLRGVPDSAPVLTYIREMLDFRGTVLERQKLANLIAGFIKKPPKVGFDTSRDPVTGKPIKRNADGVNEVALEPGAMSTLEDGEDIVWSNPPEAGTTYSDYVRTENLALAAGRNLPNELLTGDLKDISDRTLRIIINDFRRFAEQRQWQIVIPMLCERVYAEFCDVGALAGMIPLGELKAWKTEIEWSPHGWPDIHPFQDIQGRQIEVDAGFRSRSSVVAYRGDDVIEVDMERKEDLEREIKFKLKLDPTEIADPGTSGPGAKPAGTKAGKNTGESKDDDTPGAIFTKFFGEYMDLERARAATPAAAPVAPPSYTFNLPPTSVQAQISVEPTPLTVNNQVQTPTVNVNNTVEPTPFTVNNQVQTPTVNVNNDVQPAAVVVTLPTRQTTSEIKRDADGNIVNVTQTEQTI